MKRIDALTALMLAYGAASLLHFIHNAQFAQDYPNFPDTITALQVYGAWLIVGAIGLAGYLLMRFGFRIAGLLATALYAALGFDGLLHYKLAPIGAHSFAMKFTILTEVALAALLEGAVLLRMLRAVGPATERRP
jgi:uncharacterized membrane protein